MKRKETIFSAIIFSILLISIPGSAFGVETEIFPESEMRFQIGLEGEEIQPVVLRGPMLWTSDRGPAGEVIEAPLEQIPIELVSMNLVSISPIPLTPGDEIMIILYPAPGSPPAPVIGAALENSNPTPGIFDILPFVPTPPPIAPDSFFDIWIDIELQDTDGNPLARLHTENPLRIEGPISHFPPNSPGDILRYEGPPVPLLDEFDNVVGTIGEVELEPAPGALPPLPDPEFPVAGQIINLDTTALLISGLSSITIWIVPALAAVAGTGVYLAFRKK